MGATLGISALLALASGGTRVLLLALVLVAVVLLLVGSAIAVYTFNRLRKDGADYALSEDLESQLSQSS